MYYACCNVYKLNFRHDQINIDFSEKFESVSGLGTKVFGVRTWKMWNASRFCVSSLRRGHANLLCIVPILVYVLPKQVHLVRQISMYLYYAFMMRQVFRVKSRQKDMVWLYWKGLLQPTTHQRGPTTDRHGGFWLLGYPSDPVHLSSVNLIPSGSPEETMLMPTLVRTPAQHVSGATRIPRLTSSLVLTSQTQDYRSCHAPGRDVGARLSLMYHQCLAMIRISFLLACL